MTKTLLKTILVIEDDPGIQNLLALFLESEGYRVIQAWNGSEALAKISTDPPDLILLDMKMPVMDGWQFSREFHRLYDDLAPVIVMTAAADAQHRAFEIGGTEWIGKPFDLETLAELIQQHGVAQAA